jgi:hypothetical protein
MTAYKDVEKRKVYQKLWAREKAIKKRAIILEPIIEPIVEIRTAAVVESMNSEELDIVQSRKIVRQ